MLHSDRIGAVLAAVVLSLAGPAYGEGRASLTLYALSQAPMLAQQQWAADLGRVGLVNVRIQSARGDVAPSIDKRGADYAVQGVIDSRGDIVLPGARFSKGSAVRIKQWLDDLAAHGPEDQRPTDATFRLTEAEYAAVLEDLSLAVDFPTDGLGRGTAVRKLGERLAHAIEIAPPLLEVMDDDSIAEDLSSLSAGTALAYVLRSLNRCFVPIKNDAGAIVYRVQPIDDRTKAWPVGWKSDKGTRQLLPKSLDMLRTSVEGVPVTQVIEAVSQRLETPVLIDHRAARRAEIEPAKTIVNIPQRQMMYGSLLRQALFQAELKQELRVDEAGTVFIWVTPIPMARR